MKRPMARGLERIELGCRNGNCGRRADRETSSKDGFCVKDRARAGKVDEKKLNVVGLRRADAWKRRRAPATVGVRMPRGMAAELTCIDWQPQMAALVLSVRSIASCFVMRRRLPRRLLQNTGRRGRGRVLDDSTALNVPGELIDGELSPNPIFFSDSSSAPFTGLTGLDTATSKHSTCFTSWSSQSV